MITDDPPVYVRRSFSCPFCKGQFERVQMKDAAPPCYCDLCGEDVSGRKAAKARKTRQSSPVPKPRHPRDRSVSRGVISKSVDMVYRGMESASEQRMNDAAEMLGVSPQSMSVMKMTDMKDNMREGDLSDATKLVGQAETSVLPGSGKQFNGFQPDAAQSGIAQAAQGAYAHSGNQSIDMVASIHSATGARSVAASRLNKK